LKPSSLPVKLQYRIVVIILGSAASLTLATVGAASLLLLVAIGLALLMRTPTKLLVIAVTAPAPGLFLSHLVIEPIASGTAISAGIIDTSVVAYARLSSLSLFSVAFLTTLSMEDAARISVRCGSRSRIFLVWILVRSALSNARIAYDDARVCRAFMRRGNASTRARLPLRDIAPLGITLCLALLVSSADIAAAARGRGIRLAKNPLLLDDWNA
jgi:hypothetical protein